ELVRVDRAGLVEAGVRVGDVRDGGAPDRHTPGPDRRAVASPPLAHHRVRDVDAGDEAGARPALARRARSWSVPPGPVPTARMASTGWMSIATTAKRFMSAFR